ncbi:MAG: hypothetical protein IJI67_06150 [Clostridia bacterium]|nr:hypothetical protein [Clostridia bacterium]
MDSLQRKLCDMQGRLFQLSVEKGFESKNFITVFMTSQIAKGLDAEFDRTQWVGEEYLMDELASDFKEKLLSGTCFDKEVMYWIGYLYRFWHYYTGESSREILKQASPKTMSGNYLMFHTMENQMAVDNLKEIYRQKKKG